MPSLNKLAPRDQARQFSVKIKNDDTNEVAFINVEYYKNRISLAPMEARISEEQKDALNEDQLEAARIASTLCYYLKSWDLQGPLYNYSDEEVVGEGEVIPLDPLVTMFLPTPITAEVMNQLTEEVFPKTKESRNARRRSR